MKRILQTKKRFLLILLLSWSMFVNGAEPTTSASNVSFPVASIDGGQFAVSFKGGDGAGRIVVVKEGSDIKGKPEDFNKYNPQAAFGTAGSEFSAAGEYVVAQFTGANTNHSITVTNLKPGTTYYVAIFEYNGNINTPATIDYSQVTPTDKKVTTVSAPTGQAIITGFSNVTGNSLKINWTNGSGAGRIIVARKGSSLEAVPADLKSYNYSQKFGSSTSNTYILDAETFVVYKWSSATPGQAASIDITNLEPSTAYTFAIFEFNGSSSPVYLRPATIQSITTAAGPSKDAKDIKFSSVDGDRLNTYWSIGNGARRLLVVKKDGPVTSQPENGKQYTANAAFGTEGAEIVPGSGEYVVYDGASNSVNITNLEKFTTYHFAVYEFDVDANGYTYYLTGLNPARISQSTAMPPTSNRTLTVSNITGSSAQLNYGTAEGEGTYRLLVIREGSEIDFLPQDLVVYNGGTDTYSKGPEVAPGTYVLYGQSNGGAPNVKGLTPGHTYHVAAFEMNGRNAPVYLRPGATAVINVPNEPTQPSKTPTFSSNYLEGNSFVFGWSSGDGERRIVVARKGTAVTATPQDGVTYTAAGKFGTGTEMVAGSGEYVVYDGTSNLVSITGLEKGTTYHFAVFEYNTSSTGPDYLTAATKWLAASGATLSAPQLPVSNLTATNVQQNQASITFTVGNGSSRIFVMGEGAPADTEPEDYTKYSSGSNVFGVPASKIGSGYVVNIGNASSFTVTNLKPGTNYYINAYEFNGSTGPVYLKPAATHSFTTTSVSTVTAPTQEAHTPVFEAVDGNKFTFKWSSGNGANRIVVARKTTAVDFVPADGTEYTANAQFGSSADLGGEQFVVFKGNGSAVTVTGLLPSTAYHFAVFEYNGSGSEIKYMTSAFLSAGSPTATPPATKSSEPGSSSTISSINLSWTKGNGDGRIVVAKEGSEVTAVPANLNTYTANATFKSGPQIAAGEYIVYAGKGSSVTVTGLEANRTYHFSIFEYNGADAPVYNTSEFLRTSATTFSVLPVTWLYVNAKENKGEVVLDWATATEINTSHFIVESSSNGKHFSQVATIEAAGNSNQNMYYSYTDKTALDGKVYYRIRQVDIDGKFAYSKVVTVYVSRPQIIRLLQNPVYGELKFHCQNEHIGSQYIIVDATGRIVKKGTITNSVMAVPLSGSGSGMYYLSVQDVKDKKLVSIPFVSK